MNDPIASISPSHLLLYVARLFSYILLCERIYELRQHLVHDDGLGQRLGIVGQPSQCQCSRLLDGRHGVEQQRSQQRHHIRILQCLDVLRSVRQLCDGLHEGAARLLILLKGTVTCWEERERR